MNWAMIYGGLQEEQIFLSLLRPEDGDGGLSHSSSAPYGDSYYGYSGDFLVMQFGNTGGVARASEEFSDMFIGWLYGFWTNGLGPARRSFMNTTMISLLIKLIPYP